MPHRSLFLALFSGLPGCGKTTLARHSASALGVPLFTKDRLQSALRRQSLAGRSGAEGYHLLLDMADEQLSLGVSTIVDAVFPLPGYRDEAHSIALRHGAKLRPIFCFCSDEAAWQARLQVRTRYAPDWTPVGWEEVLRLREMFVPWDLGQALFVDALQPVASNLQKVLAFLETENIPATGL